MGGGSPSDEEVAKFFQQMLADLGDAHDTGNFDDVIRHLYESQVDGYDPGDQPNQGFEYDTAPWTPLAKPLSESKLVLISAGGLFVTGADPLGNDAPNQEEAIPRIGEFLRGPAVVATIPLDTPRDRISVRHPGYDIRGAVRDRNVVFPIDRLTELRDEGVIGGIADENYSFIGATSQKRLLAETAPEWAEKLKAAQVDAVLLVTA
jgi:hypothetical protein